MSDTGDRPPPGRGGPSDQDLQRAVPRDRGARETRVGIFVILGIVSFVMVLFLLTDPATLRGRYMVVTRMADAGGVRRGDPVQMRGVNIGRVHDFDLSPGGQVDITLEIEGEWRIPRGSTAHLVGMGLFGGRTVEIQPSDATAYYEEDDTLPGVGPGTDLLGTAGDVGARADTVLARVSRLLDQPTVASLRSTVGEMETLLTQLNELTREQKDEIAGLTESLARSAEGLESATAAGPDAARAVARADSAMVNLNRTSAALDEAVASLRTVLARMEAGEGTLGRLSRDDSLYLNLNRAAESVYRLVE
ncbi:MAG TPA: MlaD family protein, partial [Longimicrobiales bacterium]|nr:MlaD family protein [Longimicrobiales bacterium]